MVRNVLDGTDKPFAPNEKIARDGPTQPLSSKLSSRHIAAGAAVADQYFHKPSIGCSVSIVVVGAVFVLAGGGPSDSPAGTTQTLSNVTPSSPQQ